MEPVAAAAYVMIGAASFVAAVVGACAGALAWAVRGSVLWIGPLALAGYVASAPPLLSFGMGAAAELGGPLVVLTFLTSWLIARRLEVCARWRAGWAALLAAVCALAIGFVVCVSLFRLDVRGPSSFALLVDAFLILFVVPGTRRRRIDTLI
jgi:hypothetical protein